MTAKFQTSDIVWAKMPTYPLWPGIIITPVANVVAPYIGDESQHFVKFYGAGTNNCSWIPDKNIVLHSQDLIEKARKNKSGKKQTLKQLLNAIKELEKDIKSEEPILEKDMYLQEEEAYKKKKNIKRKRDEEQIEEKSKKPKVSMKANKEIKKTHVVIEDSNVYKNLQEIDENHQMQEEANEAPKTHQNEDKFDKSHKIQDEVTEHVKDKKITGHVKINANQEGDKDRGIENQCVQVVEIVDQVLPIKDCFTEKNFTPQQPTAPKTHKNEDKFDKSQKIQVKYSEHVKGKEITGHLKKNENQEGDKDREIENQSVQEVEIVEENVLQIKNCVTEKNSTTPQQSIDKLEVNIFSDEILSSEFWKNKSGKIQAFKYLLKVIKVLKEEIIKEEGLEKQKLHENKKKKGNDCENKIQCTPEMEIIEQRVLSTEDCLTKKDSSPSVLPNDKALVEPTCFSTEFLENIISDDEEQTEAFLKAHFETSSESEFDEHDINMIIPIRPKDIDKLQLITSQTGLNFFSQQLPRSLKNPFEVAIDWNSRKDFFFSPTPIKFGFTGNGFLRSGIVKNLLLSKHSVTLWDDATTDENIEIEEAFNLHGANRVKTFEKFMQNCDIIFSYWEDTRSVKCQMLRALYSASKEVFAKKGYVELSTLDPETAYDIGKVITDQGGRFLEAAVLGDMQDAEDGALVVLASGDQGLFNECISSFQSFAKYSYYYQGFIGCGSMMKIGHSMMQGTALAGLAEVVAFMQSYGFKEDDFTDVLQITPFQHKFWVEKAKSVFKYNYIPSRPVDDQRRDFNFGLDLALDSTRPALTCSAANDIFKKLINYDEDVAVNS